MTDPQGKLENQHHVFHIPASGIERIALALFVIACLLCPVGFSIAQEAQPSEPPATETQVPESTDETEQEGSAAERLNPETDVPEEGMVIGDGDDLAMVDNFVQIHGNALIKFEDVILPSRPYLGRLRRKPGASIRERPPKNWERRDLLR